MREIIILMTKDMIDRHQKRLAARPRPASLRLLLPVEEDEGEERAAGEGPIPTRPIVRRCCLRLNLPRSSR